MFKRFFNALGNLTASVETLTASVQEANTNFRSNLGLDNREDEPQQLDYEPAAKRKKTTAK
jgi:hypothetical protein